MNHEKSVKHVCKRVIWLDFTYKGAGSCVQSWGLGAGKGMWRAIFFKVRKRSKYDYSCKATAEPLQPIAGDGISLKRAELVTGHGDWSDAKK